MASAPHVIRVCVCVSLTNIIYVNKTDKEVRGTHVIPYDRPRGNRYAVNFLPNVLHSNDNVMATAWDWAGMKAIIILRYRCSDPGDYWWKYHWNSMPQVQMI